MAVAEFYTGAAGAAFDDGRRHRYGLWRRWGDAPPLVFVMLNPSIASMEAPDANDPTITRCVGFARREGAGGLVVANLFSEIATDPTDLAAQITSPGWPSDLSAWNMAWVARLVLMGTVVCAWGAHPAARVRLPICTELWRGLDVRCLGVTAKGCPRHPLYLAADTPLVPFLPP